MTAISFTVPGKPIPQGSKRHIGHGDADRLLTMASALGIATGDKLAMITIPGAPWSKARPRFSKKHTYASREDHDAQKRTATFLRSVVREPFPGNVGIACIFYRPNRQRIDTDNLLKHVCDAGTGVLWDDDSQCTAIMAVIELDAENPRTVVIIGHHQSTLTRGVDDSITCTVCGKLMRRTVQRTATMRGHARKTCSRECHTIALGYRPLGERIDCATCTKPFRRKTKSQKFCSPKCRVSSLRNKSRPHQSQKSKCIDCGKQLQHKRGGRCRECWRTNIKAGTSGAPAEEA